ncbi:hypothetical protein [Streptomyces varsoviensis]|uniref:hypothetical protein n=1 Tax=Streptomyces varsoviensis TaxID=67373 RepID=UPI001FE0027E|nr:hypothetical protein [Streptomyces varsoviensis]
MDLVLRRGTPSAEGRSAEGRDEFARRVCGELSAELPDEDLGEDLSDALERYELGSKPRCEEVEYLDLVQEAIDRVARGR